MKLNFFIGAIRYIINKMSRRIKGNILLLITALCWGSGFAIRKIGTAAIPPMTFNALRELVGAVMLIPLLTVNLKQTRYFTIGHNRHSVLEYRKKKVAVASIVCGSLFTVASMLQSLGLATVSAGKSGFITSMYVVLTPLIAIFLGARISRKSAGCIVLAVIGFAFLSLSGGIGNIKSGDFLLLGGAFCFAAHIIAVGRFVDKSNGLIIAVLQMFFLGVVGLAISIPLEHPTFSQFVKCLPVLIICGLVTCAIGNTAQIIGQRFTTPTSAALILSMESVFSVLIGAIVLGEVMSFRELFGCVLILIAVLTNQIDSKVLRKPYERVKRTENSGE